ncbi:MAG: hypothetical protein HY746_10385 [Elusimicrobia bacterium]|nr:hypothetical protein [Elusimicrobiota bacterium]
MPKKKKILITEFFIQLYSDGTLIYDGFDHFLWKLLHQKTGKKLIKSADEFKK